MDGRAEKLSDRQALPLQGDLIGQRSSEAYIGSASLSLFRVHWGYTGPLSRRPNLLPVTSITSFTPFTRLRYAFQASKIEN